MTACIKQKFHLVPLLLVACLVSSCANVKPYHRDVLADPIMRIVDDADEEAYENHMMRALTQGFINGQASGSGCGCEQ